MSRLIDMTGKRIGKLTVIKRGPDKITKSRNRTTWICECDCGNTTTILAANLRAEDHTKSCGCLRKFKKGEASFNRLYGAYKRNAKSRSYGFYLSKDQFKSITKQLCHYCGREPENIQKATARNNGDYIYNGIDRVDNSKGYSVFNCVACCSHCNYAKKDLSYDDFKKWIGEVYGFWAKDDE